MNYHFTKVMSFSHIARLGVHQKVWAVEKILSLKSENPQADTQVFEDYIDELVFGLYGLSEEERAVVLGR